MKRSCTNLPKRELLSFMRVCALPKDSSRGFSWIIFSSRPCAALPGHNVKHNNKNEGEKNRPQRKAQRGELTERGVQVLHAVLGVERRRCCFV